MSDKNNTMFPLCNIKFKTLEKRIDDMEILKDAVIRQTTLMEILTSENEKRDELNRKQTATLNKISENLTVLTTEVKEMKNDINHLQIKVDESENNSKIDTNLLIKNSLTNFLSKLFWTGLGITAYYLFKKSGF